MKQAQNVLVFLCKTINCLYIFHKTNLFIYRFPSAINLKILSKKTNN